MLQFLSNSANLKLQIMFDFQKLYVYQKSKNFCKEITASSQGHLLLQYYIFLFTSALKWTVIYFSAR